MTARGPVRNIAREGWCGFLIGIDRLDFRQQWITRLPYRSFGFGFKQELTKSQSSGEQPSLRLNAKSFRRSTSRICYDTRTCYWKGLRFRAHRQCCSSLLFTIIHTTCIEWEVRAENADATSQKTSVLRGLEPVASVRTVIPRLQTSA